MVRPGPQNAKTLESKTKEGKAVAQEIVAQVESGPRSPDFPISRIAILLLCFVWSGYQLSR